MAYVGPWGTFAHIPKCAGLAIRHHLEEHIGHGEEIGDYHGLPAEIESGFMVIRHPVSWLRSFWAYRNNAGWAINENSVYNWPVIVGITQWAAGLSWSDFVDRLCKYDIDIVSTVYGMYRHPNLEIYQLENISILFDDLGISSEFLMMHETPNKPDIRGELHKLLYLTYDTCSKYGYATFDIDKII